MRDGKVGVVGSYIFGQGTAVLGDRLTQLLCFFFQREVMMVL